MASGPEKEIQDAILAYLGYQGHFCWRQNNVPTPIRKGREIVAFRKVHMKGISDILGVQKRTGRIIAIEVKTPKTATTKKTYPTQDQKIFLQNIANAGGIALIGRSIDDVQEAGL